MTPGSFIESMAVNMKMTFNFVLAATFLNWASLKFEKKILDVGADGLSRFWVKMLNPGF